MASVGQYFLYVRTILAMFGPGYVIEVQMSGGEEVGKRADSPADPTDGDTRGKAPMVLLELWSCGELSPYGPRPLASPAARFTGELACVLNG